jgi:acyl-coenzyme A synthetase/AMP-(fatty) acid ligase
VSPTEIEEVVYSTGLATEAVAIGVPHAVLGQAIVVVAVATREGSSPTQDLLSACQAGLPAYMQPAHIEWREALPRNANGKIDRPSLGEQCALLFTEAAASA